MLQKIKDLMTIRVEIDNLTKGWKEAKEGLESYKSDCKELHNELLEIKKNQKEFLAEFKDKVNETKLFNKELESEVHQFKLLKSQLQNKLIEKFEEELKNELKINTERLKNDFSKYNDMQSGINMLLQKTKSISEEISKLYDISKNIKKADFEMEKFANQLKFADNEKLELMKKIDTLERLISKLRREHV